RRLRLRHHHRDPRFAVQAGRSGQGPGPVLAGDGQDVSRRRRQGRLHADPAAHGGGVSPEEPAVRPPPERRAGRGLWKLQGGGEASMEPRPRVSLILPAFNERQRIEQTIREARAYFQARGLSHEIIVAADGTDGTREHVRELAKTLPNLSVLGG